MRELPFGGGWGSHSTFFRIDGRSHGLEPTALMSWCAPRISPSPLDEVELVVSQIDKWTCGLSVKR
jgi:hypothetical protein